MSGESTSQHEGGRKSSPGPSSDDEESGNTPSVRFDWRTDPAESYSDWQIKITVGDKIEGIYDVHRGVLSAGSKYFARLFANSGLKEHETQTSHIEMEDLAAKAFHLMLDYLYSLWDTDKKPVTTENAVTLHYFGQYFEIPGLRKEARAFFAEGGMTVNMASIYLEHAHIFHDDIAYAAVVEACNRLVGIMDVRSRLMEVSDVDFWLAVLKENKWEPNPALSTLVSTFCSKNKDDLEAKTFHQLTNRTALPQLSVSAAMELWQLERFYTPAPISPLTLSSVQERGIEALTSCSTMDPIVFQYLQREFKNLPPVLLSQMLQGAIGKLLECNKKLETTQAGTPKEIVVSGAAVGAVNGTYIRANCLREGAHYYVMNGSWNGSAARFELYLYRFENEEEEMSYFISILDGMEPCGDDNDFYKVPALKDKLLLPPKKGWILVHTCKDWRKNRRPVPTLSYQV